MGKRRVATAVVGGKRGRPFRDQDATDRADLERRVKRGQTNREIAEELGLHINTVEKRISRYGLKGLRSDNKSQGDPYGRQLDKAISQYRKNRPGRMLGAAVQPPNSKGGDSTA
jgi:DNA-directed RNA polymerase specialized sigma subunit